MHRSGLKAAGSASSPCRVLIGEAVWRGGANEGVGGGCFASF